MYNCIYYTHITIAGSIKNENPLSIATFTQQGTTLLLNTAYNSAYFSPKLPSIKIKS